MTELYIFWGEIQIPTKKRQFVVTKMRETNILCGDISIPNWRRQFSIEMIPKMTVPYILCGDIQILIDRTSHFLLGHSDSNWKEKQFSIEMISKMTEPYIRSCVGTFKFQMRNAVQYRDEFKDQWTLHPLWEHSNPNWRRQFCIEMITKMTEPYIYCQDIQILTDWTLHLFLGDSNFNWKRPLIIEMITKMTELSILCGDIQIATEKDSSVLKWLQRWQKLTSFVEAFK